MKIEIDIDSSGVKKTLTQIGAACVVIGIGQLFVPFGSLAIASGLVAVGIVLLSIGHATVRIIKPTTPDTDHESS